MDNPIVPRSQETGVMPASRNPALVYLAALQSKRSRDTMQHALNVIADLILPNTGRDTGRFLAVAWHTLEYQHVAAIRAKLVDSGYSVSQSNKCLVALRRVLKEAWRLGHMTAEQYQRAADIDGFTGETVPAGREIRQGEMLALVEACVRDTSPAGVRDAAIIGILYTCGLRRSELVNLNLADVEPKAGQLTVKRGKGNKERTVYASTGALQALQDWIAVRGDQPGALFLAINKGGNIRRPTKHLTSMAVYNMLKKRGEEANLSRFSPHDFRRTFVGDMLDRGVDIAIVQKLAGHASVTTTARYDRRPEETKRQAANKLHFPYKRKVARESN